MKAAEIIRRIETLGGTAIRQKGSHVRVVCRCGKNKTTVASHGSQDVAVGTVHSIQRKLAPCFGKGWLLG